MMIFLDAFAVLIIGGAATALAGGIIHFRKKLQLQSVRTDAEIVQARALRDEMSHQAAIASLSQERALLQLTAASEVIPNEEEAETVIPDKVEQGPYYSATQQHRADTAARPDTVEDAEFA